MKKIIVFFLLFSIFSTTFSYNPTYKDEKSLKTLYKQIDFIYQNNPNKILIIKSNLNNILPTLKKDNKNKYFLSQLSIYINSFNQNNLYEVLDVIDGDTIKIIYNGKEQNIRMIGIDSPENTTTRYGYTELYGNEAKEKLKDLIGNSKIEIELDETQGTYDKYDRLLAYVFVSGINLNKEMIELGYGKEYTYNKAYKYQKDFQAAQENAKNDKLGIWGEFDYSENRLTETKNYKFYTSSYYTSHLYYCETDSSWEGLSKNYLKEYNSEQELLNDFINSGKVLNKPCEE
ncbi:MAG: thermonuclease family protein [Candidatus Gracilibacteria bacterium]|nr:thermonuclease family protein [Candidatus Gracilibacteria bacterium]